jgi:hypothetical protein
MSKMVSRETFANAPPDTKMDLLYDAFIETRKQQDIMYAELSQKRKKETVISFLGSVGGGFIAMLFYIKLFVEAKIQGNIP